VPFTSHVIALIAAGSSSSGGKSGGGLLSFLPLLLIVAVGYLLLVRPARARQRKALENRSVLEPGAEVTTTAGMLATVVSVDEDGIVTLEVAPGVHSRFVRAAIARVHTPYEEPVEDEPLTGAHEEIPSETAATDDQSGGADQPTGGGSDEVDPDTGKPRSADPEPNGR
jgi:preprotein translocase subunit YajC